MHSSFTLNVSYELPRVKLGVCGMKTNIRKAMEQVAKGADTIIASPATIEMLRNQGLPLESAPAPTLEERFEARKASAKDLVQFS